VKGNPGWPPTILTIVVLVVLGAASAEAMHEQSVPSAMRWLLVAGLLLASLGAIAFLLLRSAADSLALRKRLADAERASERRKERWKESSQRLRELERQRGKPLDPLETGPGS
jgi:hypothetical protein